MDKALVLADRLKKLKDQVDSLATKQTEIQTIKGDQGPKGEQGDRGFDGASGGDGRDGKDGKGGADGKDGVSVVKAEIDFDGSLVLYLSNGDQIDCGEVTPEKSKEVFQTIKNSGGSSPINIFTAVLPGLVPASGGGTVNFLRADGTFAAPPSGAPASPTTSVQFNDAGAFGGSANFTYVTGTNTLTVGPAGTTATVIETLAPTGATVAGTLRIRGKNASATNGAGGPLNFVGGNALGTGTGGGLTFNSGTGSNGGNLQFVTGNGASSGGNISFTSGSGTNSSGGIFQMVAGNGNAGAASGGSFNLSAGSAVVSGVGGGFALLGGGSLGGGAGGDIQIASGFGVPSGNVFIGSDSNPACLTVTENGVGVSQMGFFNAVPVVKPAPIASGTGNVLSSIVTALNNLGIVDSTTLTNAAAVFTSAAIGLVPASGGGTANFLRADGTFAAPPGGGGGSFNTGTAILNFGSGMGSNEASIAVTGQTSILSTSTVILTVKNDATSTSHSANDHSYFLALSSLNSNTPTAGTGFTIKSRSIHKLTGTWAVSWSWL